MLLPASLDRLVVKTFRTLGYTLVRNERVPLPPPLDRRQRLLKSHCIDLVVDVGANIGQYGKSMRKLGYAGRIVSFEPMAHAFRELSALATGDGNWQALQFGLGDREQDMDLHVSGNSISSSILPMLSEHEKFAPSSRYIGSERIRVRRLDDVFEDIAQNASNILLKLDVQGFEDRVLRGANASISRRIKLIQIELSFRPLYDGQPAFADTVTALGALGFDLVGIEPGFMDHSTGELLQADGIFCHKQNTGV